MFIYPEFLCLHLLKVFYSFKTTFNIGIFYGIVSILDCPSLAIEFKTTFYLCIDTCKIKIYITFIIFKPIIKYVVIYKAAICFCTRMIFLAFCSYCIASIFVVDPCF